MLSTWDDLWEFWDFWKFFENFEFHKIRLLTTEAVSPEAVLNSEPSKNTSEQLFFSACPKSKMGSNLSSRTTRSAGSFQSAGISNNQLDWTRIPDFWKVYNFIYGIVYRSKKWSFWSLTSLADSLKSTRSDTCSDTCDICNGTIEKMRQSSLIEPNCWVQTSISSFFHPQIKLSRREKIWRWKFELVRTINCYEKPEFCENFNKNSKFSTIWVPLKQRIPDLKWH